MKPPSDKVYEFVFKGLLTEEALDRVGRKTSKTMDLSEDEVAVTLSIDYLDDELVANAKRMATVYTAISAFENSIRDLISGILLEAKGESWWEKSVSKNIRERAEKRMDDEKRVRWHTQRGLDPINYTILGDLLNIMRNNWQLFEPYIHSIEWAGNIFDAVERSRNVIMHSGILEKEDIERLGIYIRDWIKQVGT